MLNIVFACQPIWSIVVYIFHGIKEIICYQAFYQSVLSGFQVETHKCISHGKGCFVKSLTLQLHNLLTLYPINSKQPQNKREINVVPIYACSENWSILYTQWKFYCWLSSFSQWLQYIFMGIQSIH